LKVDYFYFDDSEAAVFYDTVRVINPGTAGGSLCAAIYVFDSYQELSECCSCLISPDGLLTLSTAFSLDDNPLTGSSPLTGVIKTVSTATKGGVCPTYPVSLTPTAGLRGWSTHVQSDGITETETTSQDATLSAAEVTRLQNECHAIQLDGSGHGLCYCGDEVP